jgi:hypothetical protein
MARLYVFASQLPHRLCASLVIVLWTINSCRAHPNTDALWRVKVPHQKKCRSKNFCLQLRPHQLVNSTMLLTFVTPATSFALDLSPTMEVGDVLALCHTELHTSAQLALVHNGRTLSGGTLGDAGVVNNDVLHVTGPGSSAPAGSGVPSTAAAAPSRAGTAGRGRGRGAARGGLLLPRGTPAFAQIDPSVYPR